jgi:hypothetical protein
MIYEVLPNTRKDYKGRTWRNSAGSTNVGARDGAGLLIAA